MKRKPKQPLPHHPAGDITLLLPHLRYPCSDEASQLIRMVYPDLRLIASSEFRNERRDHTLQPTDLINEAILKLLKASPEGLESRSHFFGAAKRAMHQVLIDHARKHNSQKRRHQKVAVSDANELSADVPVDHPEVRDAVRVMGQSNPLWERIVDLRFYQGFSAKETAKELTMAESTLRREFAKARHWLKAWLLGDKSPSVTSKSLSCYAIYEKIGEGALTAVYRAKDLRLGRWVALKVIRTDVSVSPEFKRRFLREARCAAAINHPNIATVYDVGFVEGADFIVTEYVPGRTIVGKTSNAVLPLRVCLDYALQIAHALLQAHVAGIVHRDLKPSNILVTAQGLIKVIDFGLAKPTLSQGGQKTRTGRHSIETRHGTILGTIGYMSPEQVRGKKADPRSDIFSFGVVFYEMLTGRRAFQRECAVETMAAILDGDVPLMAKSVPASVKRVVTRCLQVNPNERYQTTRDLLVALQHAADAAVAKSRRASQPSIQQCRPPR